MSSLNLLRWTLAAVVAGAAALSHAQSQPPSGEGSTSTNGRGSTVPDRSDATRSGGTGGPSGLGANPDRYGSGSDKKHQGKMDRSKTGSASASGAGSTSGSGAGRSGGSDSGSGSR